MSRPLPISTARRRQTEEWRSARLRRRFERVGLTRPVGRRRREAGAVLPCRRGLRRVFARARPTAKRRTPRVGRIPGVAEACSITLFDVLAWIFRIAIPVRLLPLGQLDRLARHLLVRD